MERVWSHDESKDGVIQLLEPSGEKFYLCVHRSILAARSNYFERKFYNDVNPLDRVIVYVSNIRVALDMIRYMYALHPLEEKPSSREHVEMGKLFEIPEYMPTHREMSDTESRRRQRNKTLFFDWREMHPHKRKVGTREQVYCGEAFCTRSGIVREDLRRDVDGTILIHKA